MAILPGISGPQDVKRLDAKQLDELAAELRRRLSIRFHNGEAIWRPIWAT